MRSLVILGLLLAVAAPAFCGTPRPVVVFAGAAAQPPLEEAAKAFRARTGIPVTLHLGGSGAMLAQARLTGQGDLYIPGSSDYLEKAKALGLVEDGAVPLAYLVPAILVAKGNPQNIAGLGDLERPGLRVGLADPDGVCVGLYAVEILEASGRAARVRSNVRGLVESCAKAAAMIPLHLVDAVLGWREFAAWNPDAIEVVPLEPHQIPRLATIPAARLRQAANPEGAAAFLAFLTSARGQAIFQRWGYLTEEAAARRFAPGAAIGGTYRLPEGW